MNNKDNTSPENAMNRNEQLARFRQELLAFYDATYGDADPATVLAELVKAENKQSCRVDEKQD